MGRDSFPLKPGGQGPLLLTLQTDKASAPNDSDAIWSAYPTLVYLDLIQSQACLSFDLSYHYGTRTIDYEPHVAAVACAENIALNYLLHEVPEPPQQKPTEHFRGSEKEYILSFSKEKELVEVLSFLAKLKIGRIISLPCVSSRTSTVQH
jgi:hypothetical protein